MKRRFLAFLMILLFAMACEAGLRDRLQPILSGDLNISVDTFIIGTQDKYVATIVRDIDDETVNDFTMTMTDMLNNYDRNELVLIEKRIFDKNSKRISLGERNMVLKSDLQTPIAAEPLIKSDMEDVKPGSIEEIMWNGVAGPDGWGMKILNDYPDPVSLSQDKSPRDTDRYAPVMKNQVGGLFIDKESIKATVDGCAALAVQAYNYDGELQIGGMVMQYALLPYEDAIYAVTASDYSFSKKAVRQRRFTVFGHNDKIIYSVKIANPMWEDVDMNPATMPTLGALSKNLPEDLYSVMSADIKGFDEYAGKKYEEMRGTPPSVSLDVE